MKLKKNIIANYFGQFYVMIIGIVMLPFYLKYLGAEAYGLVGFFALMQSWMVLLDMGISPTLAREVAKVKALKNNDKIIGFKNLLHSLEFIFILLSLLISSTILYFSGWLSAHWLNVKTLDLNTVSYVVSLMGLMIGLRFLTSLYKSGTSGAEEQVWLNKINIIIITFKSIGVLFILHFISADIKYFFEYQMFLTTIELLIFSLKFYKIMDIGKFKIYFSYKDVKSILPFAMGIAYTSGIWILLTQLDKLLLSGILPLDEYGYFTLVGVLANVILMISGPISKAILPRMTSLHTKNNDMAMIQLYKKSTQIMSIVVFSVAGMISMYSYQLFYAWTGSIEASIWAEDILFWYVLGNGILAIGAFQYYLQFAHGNIKMHIQYNTVSALLSIPLIIWAAYTYGAIGVAITWFVFRLISFLIWTPIVHHKFAPGIHIDWIIKDILPVLISTILYLSILNYIDFSFDYSRGISFGLLLMIGIILLIVNSLISTEGRKIIQNFIKRKIK